MPRKEVPISVSQYIILDGVPRKTDEFKDWELKKMFSEMNNRAMKQLGYIPVKTACQGN